MVDFYNMPVMHPKLGEGMIKEWTGRTLVVRFEKEEKRYLFPLVFSTNRLKAKNQKDEARIQECIDRWTDSIIERETVKLGEQPSDEELKAVVAHICKILTNAYSEEEITRRVIEYRKRVPVKEFSTRSYFSGDVLETYFVRGLTLLATIFSLGIAYPFVLCWKLRYESRHSIINGRRLAFDGNARELFGQYMIWWLLSVATLGIYGLLFLPLHINRWATSHTHIEGVKKTESEFDGTLWPYLGVRLLAGLVTCVTLGFGACWAQCYLERWRAKHTSYDGYKLCFDGTGGQYFVKYLVWELLTIVTAGVFGFWFVFKNKNWLVSHTHLA